jgi:hypothetical protein
MELDHKKRIFRQFGRGIPPGLGAATADTTRRLPDNH